MIVFCTTCKNRTQHLEKTLPKNIEDNSECKFVVVDYNSEDNLLEFLRTINNPRLTVYSMREPGPFRMAHAKNMAHRLGILEGGDILVNLDADNYAGKDFDKYIARTINPESFLWARMLKGQLKRGISGRIVVTRDAFHKIGGYDEKYNVWGPDDKDFNARLELLGYQGIEIDSAYLDSIPHNDKMRFKEYKDAKANAKCEDEFVLEEDSHVIANFGRVGLGTVYRNFDFDNPIEIAPIPTRIFGIGMHKTATTSLYHALKIIGYDAEHWKNAHWAKAIWTEMKATGRSLTMEKHYAVTDLPITLLYQDFDVAYPGSKFILTIRPEEEWIKSVERHWDPNINIFRKAWNTDPFSHFIHKQLYGQKNFDREVFLQRYRRHNAEVLEYFKGRRDLLVFNAKNGWGELCAFLGRPVPSIPFPVSNGS